MYGLLVTRYTRLEICRWKKDQPLRGYLIRLHGTWCNHCILSPSTSSILLKFPWKRAVFPALAFFGALISFPFRVISFCNRRATERGKITGKGCNNAANNPSVPGEAGLWVADRTPEVSPQAPLKIRSAQEWLGICRLPGCCHSLSSTGAGHDGAAVQRGICLCWEASPFYMLNTSTSHLWLPPNLFLSCVYVSFPQILKIEGRNFTCISQSSN